MKLRCAAGIAVRCRDEEVWLNDRRLQRKLEQESRLPAERDGGRPNGFSLRRSGLVTASLLASGLLVFGLLWRAHERAQFHQLTTPTPTQVAAVPMPGGQEAVTLTRLVRLHNTVPEFASATVLPGVGMQVLQMMVHVPGHGDQPLLRAPTVAEITDDPTSKPDAAPFHMSLTEAQPAAADLIADRGATGLTYQTQADGGEVTGTFAVVNAEGKPSGVEAKVDSMLTGRSLDLDVRLRNGALASHEFSLSWSPHFAATGGDLSQFLLTVPSSTQLVAGASRSVRATSLDYSAVEGRTVPNVDFDATYIDLQRLDIGDGPVVRLTDRKSGFVLQMVLLTPSIRTVRVRTDAAAHTLMLSFSTDDGGRQTALEAGEAAEWRVRLDVLPTSENRAGSPTL